MYPSHKEVAHNSPSGTFYKMLLPEIPMLHQKSQRRTGPLVAQIVCDEFLVS